MLRIACVALAALLPASVLIAAEEPRDGAVKAPRSGGSEAPRAAKPHRPAREQAPQEPSPSDNASCPSPSRPITPSDLGETAKSDRLLGTSARLGAQGVGPVEEIVVTGSMIRRDNFDLSSPVDVITGQDIEEAGTVNMGDVLVNMASQSGVSSGETVPYSFGNLRGLGPGATMELMDGHRLLFGDANATYPQIAIERIEILTDSASALYGSEAVAGVINYIPKHRADGIELRVDAAMVEGVFDKPDSKYGILGGWSRDDTDVVFAYEYRVRKEIRQTHPRFSRYIDSRVNRVGADAQGRLSSLGPWEDSNFPGTFDVPIRDAVTGRTTTLGNGLASTSTRADPVCQFAFNSGGDDFRQQNSWGNGLLASNGKCEQNRFNYLNYRDDLTGHSAYANVDHRYGASLAINGQLWFNVQNRTGRNNPIGSTASSRIGNANQGDRFLIAGTHPGNPFRAEADGRPLFAQDANNDGIPDRDGDQAAFNARLGGNVVLASDPFDPAAGIPFQEDVYLDDKYSVQGHLCNPMGGCSRFVDSGSGMASEARGHTTNVRAQIGVEYDVADTGWYVKADWIKALRARDRYGNSSTGYESLSAMDRGLACVLGPAGDQCWNPFGTSIYEHDQAHRPLPSFQRDPALINSQAVIDGLLAPATRKHVYEQDTVDVVVAGALPVTLPGGPLSIAAGHHFRVEREEYMPDTLGLIEDRARGSSVKRRITDSVSRDYFIEASAPVLDSARLGVAEVSAAARATGNDIRATVPRESGSGSYEDTIHQIGMTWQPRDWLSVRASFGEGFVMPDQFTAFGDKRIQFVSTDSSTGDYTCEVLVDDDSTGDGGLGGTAATGVSEAMCPTGDMEFIRTVVPSPHLQGETSDGHNFGVSLSLIDGDLSVDLDRFSVEFRDQAVFAGVAVQMDGLRDDFLAFAVGAGANCGMDAQCWLGVRDEWILRFEPGFNAFEVSPGALPQDAPPSTLGLYRMDDTRPGDISHTISSYINADVAESESYDLRVRYDFDGLPLIGADYGTLSAAVEATYYESWRVTPNPAIPHHRINLAGQYGRNETLQDGGVPRWKGNASLRWSTGGHTLRLTGRYTHHMADLENSGACVSALANASCRIASWVTCDLFYAYRLPGVLGIPGATTLAVTINNLLDRFPAPMASATTPYAADVARIWGRTYNFRVQHRF